MVRLYLKSGLLAPTDGRPPQKRPHIGRLCERTRGWRHSHQTVFSQGPQGREKLMKNWFDRCRSQEELSVCGREWTVDEWTMETLVKGPPNRVLHVHIPTWCLWRRPECHVVYLTTISEERQIIVFEKHLKILHVFCTVKIAWNFASI
jgi:hypothetical protein